MNIKIKHIALYGGLLLVVGIFLIIANSSHDGELCKGLVSNIRGAGENHFHDAESIRKLVEKVQQSRIEETQMGDLKVAEIEAALELDPWIRSAEVFSEMGGALKVDLELRRPLARVWPNEGEGFYLDTDFSKMDLSEDFTANALLLRGDIPEPLEPRDSLLSPGLVELQAFLTFVHEDDFWRSQISEVFIEPNGQLTLYPEVGECVIDFGAPESVKGKFGKLFTFYKDVMNKTGWDRYKKIDLDYEGQIVASRR